jgi:hypothetical protein
MNWAATKGSWQSCCTSCWVLGFWHAKLKSSQHWGLFMISIWTERKHPQETGNITQSTNWHEITYSLLEVNKSKIKESLHGIRYFCLRKRGRISAYNFFLFFIGQWNSTNQKTWKTYYLKEVGEGRTRWKWPEESQTSLSIPCHRALTLGCRLMFYTFKELTQIRLKNNSANEIQ